MFLLRAFTAALAGVGLLQSVSAHSTERNRLAYVSRIDDADIQTPSHRVHAFSSFDLTFNLHNRRQKVRLSLTPNHDIISEDATVQILGPDGTVHAIEPIDRAEHRIFKGSAFVKHEGHSEWTNVGWARINVHQDGSEPIFEGAFRVDGDHHHIQTNLRYRQTMVVGDPEIETSEDQYMVVWRDSDIVNPGYNYNHDELRRDTVAQTGCSSDELLYNRDDNNLVYRGLDSTADSSVWEVNPRNLFGRQIDGTTGSNGAGVNLTSTIGSTTGCPTARKVALVGVATDCTYRKLFNSTSSVRANIIQQINSASQVYESTFNISLGIQNLTISNDTTCTSSSSSSAPWNVDCSDSVTITDRLNMFSKWRGQFNDSNAYWTLLSNCATGAAVGLAWLGQVCQQGASTSNNETIAAANVVVHTSTEWQVIAHETGHTFGAVHDCTSSTCTDGTVTKQQCCPLSTSSCNANGAFIMNPSTGNGITSFSQCSIGNICSFLGRNSAKVTCLTNNKDVSTVEGSQCGNGIVESGEECDCGGPSGCGGNKCCDPNTCKFTTNSVCDPANEECCTSSCQYASQGTICRASTGVCDPSESCSGTSPACPADVSSPDGTSCGTSGAGLTCASGQCTSRDLQCKTLMGSLTTGNDTYSCSSSGCQLSCASPEFGANTCYTMQQNFLDGTPCEGGGKCNNGNCDGATLGNEISSWVADNKNIVIPVACVVGLLIILAILSCCFSVWRRRRRPKAMPKPPPGWNQIATAYGAPMAPPPAATRGGRSRSARPPQGPPQLPPMSEMVPPPPPYSGPTTPTPNGSSGPWRPPRQRSFRYA